MSKVAHAFVAVVFLALGLSFIASTVLLFQEFPLEDAKNLAIAHSHLFIFFPLLGIVTLIAFYLPAVIFTDHYFKNLGWFGPVRFLIGLVAVLVLAYTQTERVNNSDLRAIWEIKPTELQRELAAGPPPTNRQCIDVDKIEAAKAARDRGDPVPVGALRKPCGRQPVLTVLRNLRDEAKHRLSLSEFARGCKPDPLLELPDANAASRFCFPAGQRLNAEDCCRIQQDFKDHVHRLFAASTTRSMLADYESYLLFAKSFFIIVLFVIGIFLLAWRRTLKSHYRPLLPAMERGVVVGAGCILFWVFMDYGYQQASDVLFGRNYRGLNLRLSLVMIPWAFILLLYFMERLGRDLERVAQMATIVGAGVTLLRYQDINDLTARLLGVGADLWHFAALAAIGVLGLVALIVPAWWPDVPERPAKPRDRTTANDPHDQGWTPDRPSRPVT